MVVDLNNEFKLEKKIGEGGLCSIWETRHRDSNEVFAFKQIKEASEINLQAILDEYRFLKFHPHPGIVEVYDFNRIDNLLGIIMEYLPGPTLENDCGNLDDDTLLATLVGILEVVNFVHHCGYIYNDYKPQNFTYDSAGKLKLIDFNLIRPQDSQDGTRSGTFGYLAPELLTGSPVSVQSDIYSLGATFYELATGTLPFIAPDEGALIKMITEATPEKPKTSNEKLNHAIMMMLSLSPEDRPSNAFETAGLLGLEVELRAKVKTNYQIYLEAGFWPYSLELVNSIKDNQNTRRPVVVVSSNEHEHDGFIKDAAILAKLEFDSAEILSGKQSTPIADSNFTVRIPSNKHNSVNSDKQSNRIRGSGKSDSGELSPQYLKDEIRRFATDSRSAKRLHLVDCQSVFDESIAALIESYDSEKLKYDDLILFAHALDIDRYANHLHIDSLLTRPDRTESYLKYYLKKYEGPDDFSEKMKLLSGGDSEIADGYIKYLIESDYFRFSERGWQAAGDFDDTKLPPAIVKGFARKESRLDENLRRLLRWLAVLDCETDLRTLAGLTGQKPNELEQALKILKTTAWLQERDGRYCFLGRAKAMAIYENILLDAKLSLHRQAADFFETNEPAAIELMARHNFAAKNYPSALKYNYQAALNWYDKFDFKKAWEFIEVAEKSTANLDQNSQYVQLLIDTYILAGDIAKALADNKPAEQKYLKAIDLAQEHGCKKSVAIANKNLGDLCRLQQKSNESITYSTVALKLYSSTEDLPNQAACLNNLGLAHWTSGNYDKALDYFEKALKLNEEMGNLQEQSKINNNIGIIYDITGKTGEVFKRFQNALECAVEVGNPELEAKILGNLGFFSLNSGKPHKALDYLIKGYEIARKIGNDNEQLNIISNIALAYHKTGDFIKSAEANQNTLEIATSLNHEMFQAQSSHLLAKDCVAMGNFKLASEMLTRAGRICSKLDNPELMVDIIQTKIELELKLGDIETCYQQLDLLTRQKSFTHKQKLKTALLELKLAFMQNDRTALAKTERLLTLCEETDFIEITGQVELELAKSALDLDQTEQVAYIIQRYQSLDIKNTIINFDYQLISARFHQHKQDFNEALDLVKRIQREANNSGCVPTLFEAAVLEAGIFDRCRKEQQAFKAVKQAYNIMKVLIGAFPEGKDENLINSLPSIKKLRELSDIYSRNSKIKR